MSGVPRPGGKYDVVVIGSGPAGQMAAAEAANAGKRVLIVEQEIGVGGACVHRGTIPSKTLRETALAVSNFRRRTGGVFEVKAAEHLQVASLMTRMEQVIKAHETFITQRFARLEIDRMHGRARFREPHEIELRTVGRTSPAVTADVVVIATGSRPRSPQEIPVDHEHVLDSDSILSLIYLPQSLTVLGAGVIACEYASIFAALGVAVTIVDKNDRPLGFMDPELTETFTRAFEAAGGRFVGGRKPVSVEHDGTEVVTTLDDGTVLRADKLLCALGRVANLEGLEIENAGLAANARGLLDVDAHFRTKVPGIYAVGDVIGPPSLASTSLDQGRRAMAHALSLPIHTPIDRIPVGIYTIPEMASIGLSEAQAIERHGGALVGRARFSDLARGQIARAEDGLLKMVASQDGRRLLGVQIVGEGAAELVTVGQMALLHDDDIDVFLDATFNFPTLAEAYRVAALELQWERARVKEPVPAGC